LARVVLPSEPLTAYPLFELIRARPKRQFVGLGSAQTIIDRLIGDEALCQAEHQGGIRTFRTQPDGVRVERLYLVHMGDRAGLLAIGVLLDSSVRVHDVSRGELAAVVEFDALL